MLVKAGELSQIFVSVNGKTFEVARIDLDSQEVTVKIDASDDGDESVLLEKSYFLDEVDGFQILTENRPLADDMPSMDLEYI